MGGRGWKWWGGDVAVHRGGGRWARAGSGGGVSSDAHPAALRSTSPFQGEVKSVCGSTRNHKSHCELFKRIPYQRSDGKIVATARGLSAHPFFQFLTLITDY